MVYVEDLLCYQLLRRVLDSMMSYFLLATGDNYLKVDLQGLMSISVNVVPFSLGVFFREDTLVIVLFCYFLMTSSLYSLVG